MSSGGSFCIFPLGDSALTIDFGSQIDLNINQRVIGLFQHFQQNRVKGVVETVPAYSSLTIYYDVLLLRKLINDESSVFDWMKREIENTLQNDLSLIKIQSRLIKIPVCYEKEFSPDIEWIAEKKNISPAEIISLHSGKTYRVYMIGFLPGFSYMGEVDDKIEVPRKLQPRALVEAGSVGIAGKQTGIYPLPSPGGWQIIGRTPMKLFEGPTRALPGYSEKSTDTSPVLLNAGDEVQFYPITKEEFLYLKV